VGYYSYHRDGNVIFEVGHTVSHNSGKCMITLPSWCYWKVALRYNFEYNIYIYIIIYEIGFKDQSEKIERSIWLFSRDPQDLTNFLRIFSLYFSVTIEYERVEHVYY